jgi:short-subunit dehydrogenase
VNDVASATGGRQTAIVTGGASGMGAEFARQLAADGYDLVLIDKSAERVAAIAAEIRDKFQAQVETIEANLADREQLERVGQRLAQIPRPGMLVNAAGFGTMGLFADVDLESQIDMIMVHVVACVHFVRAILPTMIAQKSGGIINICSINALMRFPQTVTYSSTKAYMLVFTETLHAELAGTGVRVQALCPGLTRTGFIDTPTMRGYDRTRDPVWLWMDARDVVATSLRALRRGKVTVIPGFKNRLFVLAFGSKTGIFLLRGYRRVRAFLKAHVPGFSRLP